jgi:hypothetical protein
VEKKKGECNPPQNSKKHSIDDSVENEGNESPEFT